MCGLRWPERKSGSPLDTYRRFALALTGRGLLK